MKLSLKTKLAYGFGGMGDATVYTLIGTFLLFFLTTVAGIEPATAGTIAAIGAVWEAFCAPLVAQLSDRTQSKFGRRKPFILFAAVPMAIIINLLFTGIDASYTFKLVYYGCMILLFWTGFATFFVPYLSWGAELTQDYDERTVLRSYTYLFNVAGMAMGMVAPTIIVDYLMNRGMSVVQGWQGVGLIAGFCVLVSLMTAALVIKDKDELAYKSGERVLPQKEKKKFSAKDNMILEIVKNYSEIIKLRSIRYLIGASLFYLIGYAMFCANRMYFFSFNLGLSPGVITFLMAFITFCGIVFVPFILKFNRIYDKRTIFIACLTICAAFLVGFRFAGVTSVLGVCLLSLAFALGNTCYWQLMPAMLYDVCEVDELAYDKKRAGAVISLQALSESLSQAIGLQLLGVILQLAGFDGEAAVQTESALYWVENAFSILPAFFMVLAMIMVAIYPLTRKRFNEVLEALEARKGGESVDLERFKKLI